MMMRRYIPAVALGLSLLACGASGCDRMGYLDPSIPLGHVYYVAASGGSDDASGTDATSPWATFTRAWTTMGPGDTLVLLDGTYTQELYIETSGSEDAPLRIVAANDGGAVIDGQGSNQPCRVHGQENSPVHHVVVEGIRCSHSPRSVFSIAHARDVTLRRVSAHDSTRGSDPVIFEVRSSDRLLLEDVAAWGEAKVVYDVKDTTRSTLRRCLALGLETDEQFPALISLTDSSDNLIENCMAVAAVPALAGNRIGIAVQATKDSMADRNRLVGNLVAGPLAHAYFVSSLFALMEGNSITDCVALRSLVGLHQRGDAGLVVQRMTIADQDATGIRLNPQPEQPKHEDFLIGGDVSHSVVDGAAGGFWVAQADPTYIGLFSHTHNVLWSVDNPTLAPCRTQPSPRWTLRSTSRPMAWGPTCSARLSSPQRGAESIFWTPIEVHC